MNNPFSGRIPVTPVVVRDLPAFVRRPFTVPAGIAPGVWLDVEPDTEG